MPKIEFRTLNAETLTLSINAVFVESIRQHAIGQGTPVAYVAPISNVFCEPGGSNERCVVIVLPGLAAGAIDHSATSVTPQVRTRPDGTPVACALVADGEVAIPADALNEAQPLRAGRLNVLWVFESSVALAHYPFNEDTEEWFWATAMVADGHRHETDYGADAEIDASTEASVIEVLTYFMVETTG